MTFIAFILPACKKSKNSSTTIITANRLKKENSDNGNEFFFYDSKGRIKIDSSQGFRKEYTYSPDSIIFRVYSNGIIYISQIFYLNSHSIVDSEIDFENSISGYYHYAYDADNHLIKKTNYSITNSFVSIDSYVIINGNNVAAYNRSYIDDTFSKVGIYTYDSLYLNSLGNDYYGKSFWGKSSKNVLLSENTTIDNQTFTYTYDAQNRILTKTINDNYSGPRTITYTYY